MENELSEKIPCEECISLAICLADIKLIPDKFMFFHYRIDAVRIRRCPYFDWISKSATLKEWAHLKLFFLTQKGIIIEDRMRNMPDSGYMY
jgi:hypothetical protein